MNEPSPRPSRDPLPGEAKSLSTPEIICREIPAHSEYLRASVTGKGGQLDIARLAPADQANPEQGRFILDWIIGDTSPVDRELRIAMKDSLELFLFGKEEPKPWAYLCHHCTTASNLYARESGDVWWSAGVPPDDRQPTPPPAPRSANSLQSSATLSIRLNPGRSGQRP